MPTITINGQQVTVAADRRLVLAAQDAGIDIGHRCGGKARCTTCRVEFISGEPTTMTEAEYLKLEERGLLGEVRLSCQVLCSHDMEVKVLMTVTSEGWSEAGPSPAETVEPAERWLETDELAALPAD